MECFSVDGSAFGLGGSGPYFLVWFRPIKRSYAALISADIRVASSRSLASTRSGWCFNISFLYADRISPIVASGVTPITFRASATSLSVEPPRSRWMRDLIRVSSNPKFFPKLMSAVSSSVEIVPSAVAISIAILNRTSRCSSSNWFLDVAVKGCASLSS